MPVTRRARSRGCAAAALAALVFAPGACAPDDDRAADAPRPALVRLLPEIPPRAAAREIFGAGAEELLRSGFRARVLAFGGGRVTGGPPDSSGFLAVSAGAAELAAPAALAVFADVPAGRVLRARVRFDGDDDAAPGSACAKLHAFRLGTERAFLDAIGSGAVRTPAGHEPLDRFLATRAREAHAHPQARHAGPDPGTAEVRLAVETGPVAAAVVVTAIDGPVRVREVSLLLESTGDSLADRLAEARAFGAGRLLYARLAGETRPCLWLPGGAAVSLEASAAGATALEFGLAAAGGEGDAVVRVLAGGEGGEYRAPSDGRFHDRLVKLGDSAAGAPVRFQNPGAAAVLVAAPMLRAAPPTRRPDLLLISIDTLRRDHLSLHGYPRKTTPRIDAFAARAAVFADFVAVAPYTLPAHATMLSGLLPPRHGAEHPGSRVPSASAPWLPRILARRGYHTAAFTAGAYLSEDFGFHVGFDRFSTREPVPVEDGVGVPVRRLPGPGLEGAFRYIEARGGEPWFVFLHTYAAHDYFAPRDMFERFDTRPDTNWPDALGERPRPALPRLMDRPLTAADVECLRNLYDACVAHVDREIGAWIESLERDGLLDDAVVAITSDHGEEFLEHGGIGHSVTLYEEQLRIPLLIRAPGRTDRVDVTEPVSQADLMPTLLDLLGVEVPPGLDGVSRAPWVRGEAAPLPPTPLYAAVITDNSRRAALRRGAQKLIRGDASPALPFPAPRPVELFDLRVDPAEKHDLSRARPDEAGRLLSDLADLEALLRSRAQGGGAAAPSAEVLRRLREAGYVR